MCLFTLLRTAQRYIWFKLLWTKHTFETQAQKQTHYKFAKFLDFREYWHDFEDKW